MPSQACLDAVRVSTGVHKSPLSAEEAELIHRICKGERESFYVLVQPYERAVFTAAMSILRNPADAEEVAQEAILKALSHLSGFRGESKFSTWLIQITVNEARLRLRNDRRHLYESVDEPRTDLEGGRSSRDFADWREVPSDTLERKELREALQRGLASLPPKYREVFVIRDVQHMTIRETSEVLQITEGSVKTRLLRARLQMRDALRPGFDGKWRTRTLRKQKKDVRQRTNPPQNSFRLRKYE